jgi:hypothetical protein
VVEPTTERRVRELGDRLERRERAIFADGGDLEEAFVLLASRSMRAASITWTVAGSWIACAGCISQYSSALPRPHVRFRQLRREWRPPARSNGEEAAEFRDDMLAFWAATLPG